MRVEFLLLFSLACLAFTAQAAPAAAQDALLEQKLKQRSSDSEKHDKKDGRRHQHHHHHKPAHSGHGKNPKHARGLANEGSQVAQEAKSYLVPSIESRLHAKLDGMEEASIVKEKKKLHEIQLEDTIYTAKHGGTPPKFPTVTRIGSTIGLTAAVLNIFNFIFSAKTTALATDQFSAPPTPPTLLDTAGRWDGQQYQLMPLPEDSDHSKSRRKKRSLADDSTPVPPAHKGMVKRRQPQHFKHSPLAAENEGDPNLSKRWLTPAAIGLFAGMAFSPGLPGLVRGKQGEVDPVPFDPYDPNMLKPKDSFAVAAANPGQALPALPMQKTTQSASPDAPPALGNVVFPASAYTSSATNILQQQQLVKDAAARQRGAGNSASPSVGGSAPPPSVEGQDVLRKRAVASKDSAAAELDDTKSSAPLEKRFLFGKGPWGKVSGGLALGSIAYILYKGVTHARYRTENPRDRDIIKDLDDTPMYGAVGVPKRIPGQLATNAMPGYSDYVAKLEAQQAQQQASQQATVQRQQLAAQSATGGEGKAAADASGNDPVLRRRSVDGSSNGSPSMVGNAGQTRLERRGKLLIGGGLSVIGLALGYLQSATQFPQDRDEEKDEKKREQKKQQEQQLVMQQQALAQAAQSGGMGLAPTTAGGAAYGVAPQQMPGADTSAQSVYGTGGGSITFPDSAYGSAGSASPPATGAGSFSTHGSSGASAGGASSASAALNAVAGYSSIGGGGSGSILKKRDIPEHPNKDLETRSLSKRRPGVGSFLSIAGTTMFVGTLVGNVIMGEHQKKKPVPVVTPNANTRGPMIPGGDLYTQYLESKRPSTSGAGGASGGAGIGWGAPAMVNSQAMTPASAPAADVGQAPVVESQSVAPSSATPVTSDSSAGSEYAGGSGGADSVLKKRNVPTLHKRVFPAAAIEVETAAAELLSKGGLMAEAGSGAASLLGKGAAVSEAGAGAASAVGRGAGAASRFAPAGLRGGAVALEAGFAGLGRASMAGEGSVAAKIYQPNIAAVGSARPAMLSDLGGATGRAGMPASKKGMGFAESASTPQYSREEILKTEQKIAAARGAGLNTADNGLAKEAAARGSWTVGKTFGTVGTASSASMLFNGPG